MIDDCLLALAGAREGAWPARNQLLTSFVRVEVGVSALVWVCAGAGAGAGAGEDNEQGAAIKCSRLVLEQPVIG